MNEPSTTFNLPADSSLVDLKETPVSPVVKSSSIPTVDGVPTVEVLFPERYIIPISFLTKDYSKVDRSAAYAARWVAKSLVAAGLCRRALVQLSYAIGVAEPLSIFVESYGTSKLTSSQLVQIIRKNFDLRPGVLGALCTPLFLAFTDLVF